jgi:hypothetical protein
MDRREFRYPKTKSGAVRTVMYFFNDDGDPVDEIAATECEQIMYDEDDVRVGQTRNAVTVTPFPRLTTD